MTGQNIIAKEKRFCLGFRQTKHTIVQIRLATISVLSLTAHYHLHSSHAATNTTQCAHSNGTPTRCCQHQCAQTTTVACVDAASNAATTVSKTLTYTNVDETLPINAVQLRTSLDNWQKAMPCAKVSCGRWQVTLPLPVGALVQFKFIVDEEWATSPAHNTMTTEDGMLNNYIVV